jgi:hypothetical protein
VKLPKQAKPIVRNVTGTKSRINPSFDPTCAIGCVAALAKCAFSSDPVQCLISAGMAQCIRCL